MRFVGWLLIILSFLWAAACFMSTAMMSRGVDWFAEAVLPAGAGLLFALVGVWMIAKAGTKVRIDS